MKRHIEDEDNPARKHKTVVKYFSESKLKELSDLVLSSKKNVNVIIDLLDQFCNPKGTPSLCVNTVETIFLEILKRRDMTVNKENESSEAENQYKEFLTGCYEDTWTKLLLCLQKANPECKLQALNSLFNLLAAEARYPITIGNKKKKLKTKFPIKRLKDILRALSQSSELSAEILKRMSEMTQYQDVRSNLWLALDQLLRDTCTQQPSDKAIWNVLLVLTMLPKLKKGSDISFCDVKGDTAEERQVRAAVSAVWKQLATWQYCARTQQLLLVVLVEHMMPLMQDTIFLTDYFMDILATNECEISMLALQGIFNLVLQHNIEYPDIFGKLYQLFTVKALKAKYKTRLFVLADEFLKSTHLPLSLVAAFAKRFSRLLLAASPPDLLVLLTLTANLLIRHPDLRPLYHNPAPTTSEVPDDPYLEEEQNPSKSRALDSQLWEVRLLQQHGSPRVAALAAFINSDLPSVEHELEPLLDMSWDKMIRRDAKKLEKQIPQVAEKFKDKPLSNKMEEARQKEIRLLFSELEKCLVFKEIKP